jgi:hypothetical protein
MAWTYSDYPSQTTDALRLARARQFLGELMGSVRADVSADGLSRSSGSLNELIRQVRDDIAAYERRTGAGDSARALLTDLRGGAF